MKRLFLRLWRRLCTCTLGQDTPSGSDADEKPYQPTRRDFSPRYESRTPSPSSMEIPTSVCSVEPDGEWKELEEMRNRMMHPPRNHSMDSQSGISDDSGFFSCSSYSANPP